MRTCALLIILCGILVACATESPARVITVRQDGSGEFTNITNAVVAAVANDSIEVGPGTYDEGNMVTVTIPLILYSTHGAAATILDGGNVHRLLNLDGAHVRVEGFTFLDGEGAGICAVTCGAAALVWHGAHAEFEDCIFDGSVGEKGGALYVTDSNLGLGTSAAVRKCEFRNGLSIQAGAAAYVVLGATASFDECTFDKNTTGITGAVDAYYAQVDVRGCLFTNNLAYDVAGAVVFFRSRGTIEANTFVGNTSLGAHAGTIVVQESPLTSFRQNIVDGETNGYGLLYINMTQPSHDCNVFWQNAAGAIGEQEIVNASSQSTEGAIVGVELATNEVEADPLFCDPAAGNYMISDNSPAAPALSACGERIGAFDVGCSLPLPGVPLILTIADVSNDNGRQVRIRWQRSDYDARGQQYPVTGYGVYRRQSADAVAGQDLEKPRTPEITLDGWDFLTVVPARGDAIYQYVAPTLCDIPVEGDTCWSVFFISAMTADPWTYYDSAPDSGFSVDNLPPYTPSGFTVQYVPGSGISLTWDHPTDSDFRAFRVYRGSQPDFVPEPGLLVHECPENYWMDAQLVWGACYKVTAVDVAGNESAPTAAGSVTDIAAGPIPNRFALYTAVPNPFNPRTQIDFDVPAAGGHVQLRVYDAMGRLICTLVDRHETAGRHHAVWDGRDSGGQRVTSGIYFYELRAPGFEQTLKMTLLQ